MNFRMLLESKAGTYAGMHPLKESIQDIKKFIEENDIKNSVKPSDLHVTILYSRKYLPNYKAAGYLKEPIIANVIGFDIWKSQNGKNCLVMKLESEELINRHNSLMKEHDGTYVHDKYQPHMTISYDIDELDITDLKAVPKKIALNHEYGKEPDLNWANR